MAIAQAVISTIGSTAAISLMSRIGARGTYEIENSLFTGLRLFLFHYFSTQLTLAIEEYDGLVPNELYSAVIPYLATKIDPECNQLKASKSPKEKDITVAMGMKEETMDSYNGVNFKWTWGCKRSDMREYHDPNTGRTHYRSEVQSFEVTFHKKHKDIAVKSYLPFILKQAKAQKQNKKTVKLFTTNDGRHSYSLGQSKVWNSIPLNHPATFDTLAMEPAVKAMLSQDLDMFRMRRDKYKKVGKTWKRGYLLHGPPGTGKSSLVAAMANYTGFDVYDLQLTDLMSNSDLRRLLLSTTNRSILLVEDIDCSVELHDRAIAKSPPPPRTHKGHRDEENRVTLSGFLNFIDGLWSSCGDERIIIFTTNHKEMLDPALLRPGRMDVHIEMSYCTPAGFKLLVSNYHEVEDHVHFKEIEKLIETIEVTPAEVAEQLLKNDSVDTAMEELIKFLHVKEEENEKAKVKKTELEEEEEKEKAKVKKAKPEMDGDVNEEEQHEGDIEKKKKKKKKKKGMLVKAISNLVSYWRCFGVCFLFLITWMVILGATETNRLLVEILSSS